jgi:hypothetical protein
VGLPGFHSFEESGKGSPAIPDEPPRRPGGPIQRCRLPACPYCVSLHRVRGTTALSASIPAIGADPVEPRLGRTRGG